MRNGCSRQHSGRLTRFPKAPKPAITPTTPPREHVRHSLQGFWMRKLHPVAFALSHLAILTSAVIPSSVLIAQGPTIVAGWTLYKNEHACSLGQNKKDSFIFFSVSAEGRQFLRLHNRGWHFNVGDPVQVNLSAGGRSFDLAATGASTTNGWQGFTASPQGDVLSALSSNDQVSMSTEGAPPVDIDLSGLHEAMPNLMECAAPLKKRESAQIAVKGPRVVQQPLISPNDLPRGNQPSWPLTYKLVVGENGMPTDCSITKTSGSASVDERVCALLRERSRIEPALNDAGQPVASSYQGQVAF